MTRHRVAVIGPGRAGTTVGAALVRAGHRVVAVAGGSPDSRARFASQIAGARALEHPTDAARGSDLVLIATPDEVIEAVVSNLASADAIEPDVHIVHLSGAHGLAPLRRAALAGARVAACHPAQTMPWPPDPDVLLGACWGVTARAEDRPWAHDLVVDCGGRGFDVPEERRVLYHAALALGSNAAGAAVAGARALLMAAGVDDVEAFLGPLVEVSTSNALRRGAEALTGPIVRGDLATVRAHLETLRADVPRLADAYAALSEGIVELAVLDPELRDRLRAVLRSDGR